MDRIPQFFKRSTQTSSAAPLLTVGLWIALGVLLLSSGSAEANTYGLVTAVQAPVSTSHQDPIPKPNQLPTASTNSDLGGKTQVMSSGRDRDYWFVLVFCFLAALTVISPIIVFLLTQWSFRRNRLFGSIAGDAVVFYYKQFRPGADVMSKSPPGDSSFDDNTRQTYLASFKKDFYRWYGRGYYVWPVTLLAILTGIAAWWAAGVLHAWTKISPSQSNIRTLVAAALAGGFTWVISDEIDRLRKRDFTTIDVYNYIFRILLAIPFAWALTFVSAETAGSAFPMSKPVAVALAFFLGAFPTTTLFTIARRIASQTLKLGDDPTTGNELEQLQSVTKTNAERFRDQGITTITNLAHADPIDLTIRTNLDFKYVLDCVSESLVWIYFGNFAKQLFPYSLRGAQEVVTILEWLLPGPHQAQAAQAIADACAQLVAAAKITMDKNSFTATLEQIKKDPYTQFLLNLKV